MFISIAERKKIQTSLENLMETAVTDESKNLSIILLSLIYELNQKDAAATPGAKGNVCPKEGGVCIWKDLTQIHGTLASLEIPPALDETYLREFSTLANSVLGLANTVHSLFEQVQRNCADAITPKIPHDAVTQ